MLQEGQTTICRVLAAAGVKLGAFPVAGPWGVNVGGAADPWVAVGPLGGASAASGSLVVRKKRPTRRKTPPSTSKMTLVGPSNAWIARTRATTIATMKATPIPHSALRGS
jgi:hypothetical protein